MIPIRRTVVAAVVVLAVLAVPVAPAAAQSDSCAVDDADLETTVDTYNANLDRVPGLLRGQLADERVAVVIGTTDGDREYGAVTDGDARVTGFTEGPVDDPTLRVETDETTVCSVLESGNPVATALDAYQRGDVTVEGVGVVDSVTLGLVRLGIEIARTLGLL